jgi:hypothetical protein
MLTSDDLCYTDKEKKLLYWCKAFQAKTAKELLEVLEGNELMENEATEKYIDEVDKYSTNEEVYQIYTEYSREEMERNTANINLELKRQEVDKYEQEVEQKAQEVKKREQDVEAKSKELDKAKDNLVNQGKSKRNIEIVKNASAMHLTIEDIIKLTNLSKEEIEDILKFN